MIESYNLVYQRTFLPQRAVKLAAYICIRLPTYSDIVDRSLRSLAVQAAAILK